MRTSYPESHPLVSFADGSEVRVSEWPLSRLLINEAGANVRSDLCEERGGCADIILAVAVNFCTLSCISLH